MKTEKLTDKDVECLKSLFGDNWMKIIVNPDRYCIGVKEKEICEFYQAVLPHGSFSPTSQECRASRIVRCVNACEGVVNPEAIPEVIEAVKNILNILKNTNIDTREIIKLQLAVASLEGGGC